MIGRSASARLKVVDVAARRSGTRFVATMVRRIRVPAQRNVGWVVRGRPVHAAMVLA